MLMGTDMKVLLMLPTQAAFGFSAAMMNAWVNGFLVTKFLGSKYTGSLSALTTVVAWLASQLASWYSSHGKTGFFRGKPVAMLFGDGAFITLGLVVMLSSCDTLRSWPVVIALFVLQGLGRGIFESTNKARLVPTLLHSGHDTQFSWHPLYHPVRQHIAVLLRPPLPPHSGDDIAVLLTLPPLPPPHSGDDIAVLLTPPPLPPPHSGHDIAVLLTPSATAPVKYR